MYVKRSLFFVIVFVLYCFTPFFSVKAASGVCDPGYFLFSTACRKCNPGCYCTGGNTKTLSLDHKNEISSSEVEKYCKRATNTCSHSGQDGYGACGRHDAAQMYRCPDSYPNNSKSGSTTKNECYLTTSAGKYVDTAGAGQVSCKAGYMCSGGTKIYYTGTGGASKCPAGKYSTTGSSSCTDLAGGYYGGEGATSNQGSGKVNAGYYSTGGGTSATPTSSGGCLSSYSCGIITKGYYGVAGASTNKGSGKVNSGYYSTGGGTSATPTAPGNGCLAGQQCGKCASNAKSNDEFSACKCKDGYSIGGGTSAILEKSSDKSGSTCAKRAYTLKYDLNGGSGTKPASQSCTYGNACSLASMNVTNMYKAGHKLVGWSYSNTVYTTSYTASGGYSSEIVLKAVWEKCGKGTYHGSEGAADTCLPCPTAPAGWGPSSSGEGSTSAAACTSNKAVENCNGALTIHAENSTKWGDWIDTSGILPKAGYYRTGSGEDIKCVLCPAGTIAPNGAYSAEGCTKCDEGKGTNAEHTECVNCGATQYVNAQGFCADCPDNFNKDMYSFTNDKTLGSCAIKLGEKTVCNKKDTKVIYTYDGTNYVRKEGFKVAPGDQSVVKAELPPETDIQNDYCETCGNDKYRVKDNNGNWVCGFCNGGSCLDKGSCTVCPAGHKCPFDSSKNLECSEAEQCGQDEYADTGSESCSKCAMGYSTFYSGPSNAGFDDACLGRSDNQYGIGCKSAAACKLIPIQFCFSADCRCSGNKNGSGSTFIEKRDNCGSSFPMPKHVKFGKINESVVYVNTQKISQ